ncbi:MAG TPA: zinc ribbon domain-containing protein [Acidobacteria bacterium]|nr:zinc ribbon domain-containing protein [Acidobacteriota bacterium]
MPIFEYECRDCQRGFELLVRAQSVPACPSCDGTSLRKRLSAFAVGRGEPATGSLVPPACGSCGDPRGPGSCSIN